MTKLTIHKKNTNNIASVVTPITDPTSVCSSEPLVCAAVLSLFSMHNLMLTSFKTQVNFWGPNLFDHHAPALRLKRRNYPFFSLLHTIKLKLPPPRNNKPMDFFLFPSFFPGNEERSFPFFCLPSPLAMYRT